MKFGDARRNQQRGRPHDPQSLLAQFLAAFQAGDSTGLAQLFDPRSSYKIGNAEEKGASWQGGDAIVSGLMQIRRRMGSRVNLHWGQIAVIGREAVCHWSLTSELPDGQVYRNSGKLRTVMNNGRILKVDETLDLQEFRQLVHPHG